MKNLNYNNIDIMNNLLQVSIKKGKKANSEKIFRQALIYFTKTQNEKNLTQFIESVILKIQPVIKLQKKKYKYKPSYATEHYKKNQAALWILNEVNKKKNKFSQALILELLAINNNNSTSIKQREKLYNIACENIIKK